jgi:hypothetical protein
MAHVSKNIFWLSLSRVTGLVLLFFAYTQLFRYLGPYGTGQYQFVLSLVTIFGVIIDLGISQYVTKKVAEDHTQAAKYFYNFFVAEVVLAAFVYAAMVFFVFLRGYEPVVREAVMVAGAGLFLYGLTVPFLAVLSGFQELRKVAINNFVAIGGGNALAHPDIMEVFPILAARGIILNVTVNQEHLLDATYMGMLLELIQKDVIHGVGISVTDNVERVAAQLNVLQRHTNNVVYHIIAGVNTVEVLAKLEQISSTYKVLVLGYKQHGRGNKFYQLREKSVVDNLCRWYQFLPRYIGKNNIISFDNLAIKQLNVRRLFSDREWQSFYMGDDGTHTFYIDLIEQKFANSSTTEVQYPLLSSNIEMFQQIRPQYAS